MFEPLLLSSWLRCYFSAFLGHLDKAVDSSYYIQILVVYVVKGSVEINVMKCDTIDNRIIVCEVHFVLHLRTPKEAIILQSRNV